MAEPEHRTTDCHSEPPKEKRFDKPAMPIQTSYSDFFKRTLIVVAAATIPLLIWYLSGVILMVFGAIILAMLLRLVAEPFMRWLRAPEVVALIVSGIIVLGIIAGTGYLFGSRISNEFQDVTARASSATAAIERNMQSTALGNYLLQHMISGSFSLSDVIPGFLKVSTTFLEAVIIVLISGIYLAAQPRHYRSGLIWLFPPSTHARAAEIFDGIAEALRLWLLGQIVEMILIGVLTTFAVWIIGVPSPLAIGLIAGIGEFIPYLGPILAAIPAVLVAITKSPETALWTLLVYLVIHQIEGQIVAPLIQRHMVAIPPAVMLLGIVAITYLFGAIAIIFAAPIAVVIFAAVNLIYVRDTLGEKTTLTRKLG
jgi:predicted PurR-regulated permease PerM